MENEAGRAKKGGRRINSTTGQIRQAASALGHFSRKQLVGMGFEVQAVTTALDTLKRQGRVKAAGYGAYEFVCERESARTAPVEDRIWHAMRINPVWSCSEISLQAGTTVSYVYKRLREYRAEGFVARRGVRPVNGAIERLWRLTAKGRTFLARPAVEIFEPDPRVLLSQKISKLVATGMALRFEDAREAARSACLELVALLGESEAPGITKC